MSTDNTDRKQSGLVPFKPGQSGNPAGRPKGARNKLGEEFVQALYADWEEHGKAAIEKVREARPHEYLKLIASLVPKQIELPTGAFDDVSDDELSLVISWARAAIGEAAQEARDEADEIAAAYAPDGLVH